MTPKLMDMIAKENDKQGPCRWLITRPEATPLGYQCHETARCPHIDDAAYICPCLPRAREVEVGIIKREVSGEYS